MVNLLTDCENVMCLSLLFALYHVEHSCPFSFILFRIYKEKLTMLKKQLQQVIDGSHPELLRKIKKLEQQGKDRMRLAEVTKNAEVSRTYLYTFVKFYSIYTFLLSIKIWIALCCT